MALFRAFEAEARAQGATRLVIESMAVGNNNFFRMQRLWEQLGATFVPVTSSRFEVVINLGGQ